MIRRIRWQILIAAVGSLVVLALLGSLALSTSATALPFYTKAYVEAVVGVPQQLHPLLQRPEGPAAERDLAALLFEGLTRTGADGAPAPALAEQWTSDPGASVYTFTLRSDLRWHDGAPLTADDVLFTVRSVQHARFGGDQRLAEFWRTVLVEQIDSQRIRFRLSAPFAPFLSATNLPILPAHLLRPIPLEQWTTTPWSRRPVGSGPFRLQTLDEAQATLRPFEGSVRGRPAIDLLILRFYPSEAAAREALRRRDVQGFASVAAPGERPAELARHVRATAPLGAYTLLTLNLREPPLDDPGLRAALAQGLDRRELLRRVLDDQGTILDTPIMPQTWAAAQTRTPAYDRSAAERALDAAGWRRNAGGLRARDGQTLRLTLLCEQGSEQIALANEVARQWELLGMEVTVEPAAGDTLLDRVARRDFVALLHSWNSAGADPDPFALWHSSQAEQGLNYAGLSDTRGDELIEQARATTDQEARTALYADWQERWAELVPSIPLYQHALVYDLDPAVQPAGLDETRLLPTPSQRFDRISDWTVQEP